MNEELFSTLLIIFTVLICVGFISYLVGSYVYKKTHNLPTGDCACCHLTSSELVKEYRKKYGCKNCNHPK